MDVMELLGVLGYGSVEEWALDSGYDTDGIAWFDSDGETVDIEANFVGAMDAAGYSVDHGDVFAQCGEWVEVSICDDCAMWQANGDLSGVDDPEHAESVTGVRGRWVVGEPQGFSWHRCDACRDHRGGSRFQGWFWLGVHLPYDEEDHADPALIAGLNAALAEGEVSNSNNQEVAE